MSSKRNWIVTSSLGAGANDNPEYPSAIPNGETWMIEDFRAGDINLGDNKSSWYVLRFGTEIIEFISVTGNTQTVKVDQEFTGDGTKKINVLRFNESGFAKKCGFKVMAYKRQ